MKNKYALDTSAIVAMLKAEPGAEYVRDLIRNPEIDVILPWVVLYEIYYLTTREKNENEAKSRYLNLLNLPITIVWQEQDRYLIPAAKIKAAYPLSVADSWIMAIAEQEHAILVHKDPEMEALAEKVQMEILPYK